MAEDRRRFGADQLPQQSPAFGIVQAERRVPPAGVPARVLAVRRAARFRSGGDPGGGLPVVGAEDLRQCAQQRAVAARLEHRGEPVPVDVGDHRFALAQFHRPAQRVQRRLRFHRDQPVAAQPLADHAFGHARARPGPPGHRGRREPATAPPGGEGVEVGVGGGVAALAAAAPGRRDRGEQDEGVQCRAVEERVEVVGSAGLGGRLLGQPVERQFRDRGAGAASRRVDDRPYPLPGVGQLLQHFLQRRPVGDVAGRQGAPGAERGQFGLESGRARGVRAAPAQQDQVFGALRGEAAGQCGAEAAGAAGDQDGAARLPGSPGVRGGDGGPAEPSSEQSRGPDRDLVLPGDPVQRRAQGVQRAGVQAFRQVDQAAPALRLLQCRDPAEAPDLGLPGVDRAVAVHADGPARGAPQRRVQSAVAQCLDQQQRPGQPGGQLGAARVAAGIERQQRQHAGGHGGRLREQSGQFGAPGPAAHPEHRGLGAVAPDRPLAGLGLLVGVPVRDDQQPATAEPWARRRGERTPLDAVAPTVGRDLGLPSGQPGRERPGNRTQV